MWQSTTKFPKPDKIKHNPKNHVSHLSIREFAHRALWLFFGLRGVQIWPRTNSDTIVSIFIWFCYLEWMINGGNLIWCDLLTSKIYEVEGTLLVSVRIFVHKINTYHLKDDNTDRVKYWIVTWHLHLHLLLVRWYNLYRHHTNQLVRKVKRLCEGLKLYYDRFWSRNGPGIFHNSGDNHESWSQKSDCVTLGKL